MLRQIWSFVAQARRRWVSCACWVRPALLVPSPFVAENHQEKNARALEKAGGCRVLLEKDASPQKLYEEMQLMLADRSRLQQMGQAATSLAAHDASEKIYREILWAIEHHGK